MHSWPHRIQGGCTDLPAERDVIPAPPHALQVGPYRLLPSAVCTLGLIGSRRGVRTYLQSVSYPCRNGNRLIVAVKKRYFFLPRIYCTSEWYGGYPDASQCLIWTGQTCSTHFLRKVNVLNRFEAVYRSWVISIPLKSTVGPGPKKVHFC